MSSVWNNDKGLSDFIELSRNPDFVVILVGLQLDFNMSHSKPAGTCNDILFGRCVC